METGRTAAVADLLSRFYEATLDGGDWDHAAKGLCDHFNAAALAIVFIDLKAFELRHGVTYNIPTDGFQEYLQHYYQLDPRALLLRRNPDHRLFYDYLLNSEKEIRRSEYYHWVERRSGLRYFVTGRLYEEAGVSAYFTLQRTAAQGHVDQATLREFELFLPHLSRAVRLGERLHNLGARHHALEEAAHHTAEGLILLDAAGRVLFLNHEAERILQSGDLLRTVDGALTAIAPENQQRLTRLIAQLQSRQPAAAADDTIELARGAGRAPCRVQGWRPSAVASRLATRTASVGLFLIDPERAWQAAAARLRERFGLSPAELRVAELLVRNLETQEIAARLKISPNTARLHVEHILKKSGSHRRAQFVQLALRE